MEQLYVCWFSYRNDEKSRTWNLWAYRNPDKLSCTCNVPLEKRGFVFDESSFKYDAKGNITVAYLKDEIAGFAVHFNQK